MNKPTFSDLNLSPEIFKAVATLGYEEASPIQAATIPILLEGRDLVGQSQTGSGKTAAFAIPAIEKVDPENRQIQALVLCPTRELATQVANEVHKLSNFKTGVHEVPIYGGASYDRQFFELKKGVQIVIATPGRLMDHMKRGTVKLDGIKMVILDEADRMLDMGFRDDIAAILEATPTERQTVFFSATVSPQIQRLIKRYARDPETVRIKQKAVTVPTVEQFYYEVRPRLKVEALIRLLDFHAVRLGIVFCNTQRMVDELADQLLAQGFAADRLHGAIAQAQRTRVMNKFKKAEFDILVATDVAARGIDVDDLELVVNFDLPYDPEDYVHRIGRTGRVGREGVAATFVSGRDIYKLQYIERFTRTRLKRGTIPTMDQVEERRTGILFEKVQATLEAGQFRSQTAFVDRLLERGFNPTEITSALVHHLLGTPSDGPTSPPPIKQGHGKPSRNGQSGLASPNPDRSPPPRVLPPSSKPASATRWISLSIGRDDGFGPREILDLVAGASGVPGGTIGTIELTARSCIFEIERHHSTKVIRSLDGAPFKGRPLKLRLLKNPVRKITQPKPAKTEHSNRNPKKTKAPKKRSAAGPGKRRYGNQYRRGTPR
jgi:ATP-dependent RNA helicase DeaD